MQKYPNVRVEYMDARDGKAYNSLIEAVQALGYTSCIHSCKNRFNDWSGLYSDFVVRDTHGCIISKDIVKAVAENHAPPNNWYRSWSRRKNYIFRRGPVEGIGRCSWNRLKGPATTQERRENDFLQYDEDAIEHNIKPRSSRQNHNLPTSWDDWHHRDYHNLNWKHYRKHQWKDS